MMAGWYYCDAQGKQFGPVDAGTLRHLAHSNVLNLDSLLCHETATKGQWVQLNRIKELREQFLAGESSRAITLNPMPVQAAMGGQSPFQHSQQPHYHPAGQSHYPPTTIVVQQPAPQHNVALAIFLAFLFPGLGQLYNGDLPKAFMMGGIYLGCLITGAFVCFPFVGAFGVWIWGIVDAYQVATEKVAREVMLRK